MICWCRKLRNMVCWCYLFTCLNQNPTFSPPLYRQHSSRLKGPFLHRPVWAGAPEASCCQPPAVCRSLLQGRQSHPEERRCQAPAGPWCCHSSAGSAWTLRHWPGETGHWEGPSKEATANGKIYFGISKVVRRLWSGDTIIIIHINFHSHGHQVIIIMSWWSSQRGILPVLNLSFQAVEYDARP